MYKLVTSKGFWIRYKTQILILCVLMYVITYLVMYPSAILIYDNQVFSQQAQDLLDFRLRDYNLDNLENRIVPTGVYAVSHYPIGNALFIAPFLLFGYKAQFLLGLVLHLLTFYIILQFLRRYGLSEYYGLLFLFNPFTVIFSRYIFSDSVSMFLLVLAAYFFTKDEFLRSNERNLLISATAFSLLVLTRHQNVFLLIPVFCIIFSGVYMDIRKKGVGHLKDKEILVRSAAFMLPFFLTFCFLLGYNNYLFGSPFIQGYSFLHSHFDFGILVGINRIIAYLIWFSLLLPLSGLFLFVSFSKKFRKDMFLFRVLVFIPVLFYSQTKTGISLLSMGDWITGLRFILMVFPLLLLIYAINLDSIHIKLRKSLLRIFSKLVFLLMILLFFIGSLVLSYVHYSNSVINSYIAEDIYSSIPKDAKLLIFDEGLNIFHSRLGNNSVLPLNRNSIYSDGFIIQEVLNHWDDYFYVESGLASRDMTLADEFKRGKDMELIFNRTYNSGNPLYNRGDYVLSIYHISR